MEPRYAELKKRLSKVLSYDPKTIRDLAKVIGINHTTLGDFLNDRKPAALKTLGLIENFINQQEAEYKLNEALYESK